ncbi:MAG TPA: hypothetical protein VMJ70_09250 [Candidatus Sulfotelmatobacter sp.]|nr:hypothetical protein [Candidatus Sulfotelmatobacter sp.]
MSERSARATPTRRRPDPELLGRVESMAVRARERHWALLPEALARRLKPLGRRFADGFATLMSGSESLRVNRVIGVGHRQRVSRALLAEIIQFYRDAGIHRFGFELGPGPQFRELGEWLEVLGLVRRGGFSLYLRDLRRPIEAGAGEVVAKQARGTNLTRSIELAERIFSVPASRRSWTLASARSGQREHFLASIGATPIGVGALQVEGELAWLGGGGTLTRYRRRGAQSALIAARLRRAAALGCRWAWSETAAPRPGRPQGSRRNLLRLGFEEVLVKPSFVWEGGARGASPSKPHSRVGRGSRS